MGKWIQNRDANWRVPYTGGWCLKYVQDAFNTAHWYPSAIDQWYGTERRHLEEPPLGITVPIYFSLGDVEAGHVAIRLDDGMVASSTQDGTHPQGYIHKNIQDLINTYAPYNGGCEYLGWGETLADTVIVTYQPDVTTKTETKETVIPFAKKTIEDNTTTETKVITAGVNGKRIITYSVTYTDGIETKRSILSDITTPPIEEVTQVGTKTIPEPEAPTEPQNKPQNEIGLFVFIKKLIEFIIKLIKGEK